MQVTTETLKCPDICYRCCWCSGGRSLLWRQSEERMTYQGHHDRRLGLPSSTAWKTDLFDWDQSHLWWFKGIVRWEVDSQEEHTSLIRTVRLKDKRAKFKHPRRSPNWDLKIGLVFHKTMQRQTEWISITEEKGHWKSLSMKVCGKTPPLPIQDGGFGLTYKTIV